MSRTGNQLNPSIIHPSSRKPDKLPMRMGNMTAPPPNRKPDKSRILEMHEIFLGHDTRGDNKISIRQLGDCLRVMGANPTEAMVSKHVREFRVSSMERISFDEVMTIYSSLGKHGGRLSPKNKKREEEQFTSCLKIFDTDNSGLLSAIRLRRLLTECGDRMSPYEVDDLLKGRIDEQGMVNYKKLIHDIIFG
ncbi:myosin-2 essential light chain [Drosophila eugracilis]|uniref:myosin-2 essential light chain n=1 Tax=Drosophila eugracilis TaxID=29029 RepID=UPI0007E6BCFB|nr:myosin-2 essential light chain [Drosophila eugracilis]